MTEIDYYEIDCGITQKIVRDHLFLLEKKDFNQLAKVLGISLAQVKTKIEIIKSLDPTPGRKYSQEKTFYVVPDIIVTKEGNEYTIVLNNEGLPQLKINNYYKKILARASKDNPEAYRFLKEKVKKAFWFLRSLDQRNQTIFRVAKYIVDQKSILLKEGLIILNL